MAKVEAPKAVVKQLTAYFNRNGYVRYQNTDRLATEPYGSYKKGDEVRLVANSASELRQIRQLLQAAGFNPGRPFGKDNQWRLPLYGREAVARFLSLVGAVTED